jgi:two-component system, repressor protein LuxO
MVRILIVEDDREMRALLQDFLAEEGFDAETTEGGEPALRKLTAAPFDLIITDLRTSGLSGWDLLPGARRLQPGASIVAIADFGSDGACRRAMEKGATACLEKPLHLEQLKTFLSSALTSRRNLGRNR